jgi:hypothetical protein
VASEAQVTTFAVSIRSMHSIGHRLVTAVERDMNERSVGVLFGQPCSLPGEHEP